MPSSPYFPTSRRISCYLRLSTVLVLSLVGGATRTSATSGQTGGVAVSRAWTPRVEARSGPENSGELRVNDQTVLRLREAQGGLSPLQRAATLANRLQRILQANPSPFVEVATTTDKKGRPQEATLRVGRQALLTLTTLEARQMSHPANATAPAVVQPWATRLREALALPGLRGPIDLLVPEGESRTFALTGAARGAITSSVEPAVLPTTTSNTALATVTTSDGNNLVRVEGRRVGKGRVVLERDGALWNVRIVVRRWAGAPAAAPDPILLTGVGDEASRDRQRGGGQPVPSIDPATVLQLAVARAIASLHVEPDAVVRTTAAPTPTEDSQSILVPLSVKGPGLLPVLLTVRVPVGRGASEASLLPTARLLYSNAPERVTRLQTLFVGQIAPAAEGSTRLLFHHQSAMHRSALFEVSLVNEGDTEARVEIRGGVSGPVLDTVWVGVRAGEAFLRAQRQRAGCVVTVPARSRIPLVVERLPAGQTLSGLCELLQTSGAPLRVEVATRRITPGVVQQIASRLGVVPFLPELLSPSSPAISADGKSVISSGASYPDPRIQLSALYSIGDPWRFMRLGRRETVPGEKTPSGKEADSSEPDLAGHYGFTYEVNCVLKNPSDRAGVARLVFEPSAGLAGGVFVVDSLNSAGESNGDGSMTITVPQAREDREVELTRVLLPPGTTRRLRVTTVPLSGSNYPARLIIRP